VFVVLPRSAPAIHVDVVRKDGTVARARPRTDDVAALLEA
jgi:hypothetical protein